MQKLYPLTVVDDFLDNVEDYRKLALSTTEWKKGENYPGLRSSPLHELDRPLFDSLCKKIFNLWYDLTLCDVQWEMYITFQKVNPVEGESPWIHRDTNSLMGGVIYLTPENEESAGTSFYDLKISKEEQNDLFNELEPLRIKKNLGQIVDPAELERLTAKNNGGFEKTIDVKNKYNRLVAFGSHWWHTQSSYIGSPTESRMVIAFFAKQVYSPAPPLLRHQFL